MSAMREEELWQKLVDETGEALIEEAAAVSVEQAEKDLAAWGFDVKAERARAAAFLASLEAGTFRDPDAAEAEPQPAVAQAVPQEAPSGAKVASIGKSDKKDRASKTEKKKERPIPIWVAAAAAAVTAGAAVAYVATRPEEGHPPSPPAPTTPPSTASPAPSPDLVAATSLRHRAEAACNMGHFGECTALLDQARDKDPAGDTTPEVQRLRDRAEQQFEAKPK